MAEAMSTDRLQLQNTEINRIHASDGAHQENSFGNQRQTFSFLNCFNGGGQTGRLSYSRMRRSYSNVNSM